MFHSTSGKCGYDLYDLYKDLPPVLDRETLKEILISENELRFSEEIQAEYSNKDVENYLSHIRDVTVRLQMRAIELHFKGDRLDKERALNELQCYRFRYGNDRELLELSVYGRLDDSKNKNLENTNLSTEQMNIEVLDLEGSKLHLGDCFPKNVPLVLMGASIS